MKLNHNLTTAELNNLIKSSLEDFHLPTISRWERVDVGQLETYVGDRNLILSFVEILPKDIYDMEKNDNSAEEVVVSYLHNEGFIDNKYLFIGMQRIDLDNLPQGMFDENEESEK